MKRKLFGLVTALSVALAGGPALSATVADGTLLALQSKAAKNGTTRVIVEFEAPAGDLSGASDAALSLHTSALRRIQNQILAGVTGGADAPNAAAASVRLMDIEPMLAMNATPAQIAKLAANPLVKVIHESKLYKPLLDQSLPIIKMAGSGSAFARGATGRGRAVAILDTGVLRNHEFLRNRVIFEGCFSTSGVSGSIALCNKPSGANAAKDCPLSVTGCGHGTHVAGIAAGNNTSRSTGEPSRGVAPSAGIVAMQVFSKFPDCSSFGIAGACVLSFTDDQIGALEQVYKMRNGVAGRKIDAINMSLGGGESAGFCNTNALAGIIRRLRTAGIATVIASGNDGFTNSVSEPGCIQNAITVGASTKRATGLPDRIASYSNQGPQVDVLAPGGDFTYPNNDGRDEILSSTGSGYDFKAGTSMATPHVAGAIAAIRSKASCRNKTVGEIEAAFRSTGPLIDDHRSGGSIAKRRLDVLAAMKRLRCA